jgi:prophage regulatory protein
MHLSLIKSKGNQMKKNIKLIKLNAVIGVYPISKSGLYEMIKQGLFPTQIHMGLRNVAWLEHEVLEIISAQASLKSKVEIKQIVSAQVNNRFSLLAEEQEK